MSLQDSIRSLTEAVANLPGGIQSILGPNLQVAPGASPPRHEGGTGASLVGGMAKRMADMQSWGRSRRGKVARAEPAAPATQPPGVPGTHVPHGYATEASDAKRYNELLAKGRSGFAEFTGALGDATEALKTVRAKIGKSAAAGPASPRANPGRAPVAASPPVAPARAAVAKAFAASSLAANPARAKVARLAATVKAAKGRQARAVAPVTPGLGANPTRAGAAKAAAPVATANASPARSGFDPAALAKAFAASVKASSARRSGDAKSTSSSGKDSTPSRAKAAAAPPPATTRAKAAKAGKAFAPGAATARAKAAKAFAPPKAGAGAMPARAAIGKQVAAAAAAAKVAGKPGRKGFTPPKARAGAKPRRAGFDPAAVASLFNPASPASKAGWMAAGIGIAKGLMSGAGTAAAGIKKVVAIVQAADAMAEKRAGQVRSLGAFNGSIMGASVGLQMGDMRRNFDLAFRTSKTATDLLKAVNSKRDSWQDYNVAESNIRNRFAKNFAELSEVGGRLMKPLAQALNSKAGQDAQDKVGDFFSWTKAYDRQEDNLHEAAKWVGVAGMKIAGKTQQEIDDFKALVDEEEKKRIADRIKPKLIDDPWQDFLVGRATLVPMVQPRRAPPHRQLPRP